jgi:hypothetical protein
MPEKTELRSAVSHAEMDLGRDRSPADSDGSTRAQPASAGDLFAIERQVAIGARRIAFQRELVVAFANAGVSSSCTNRLLASMEELLVVSERCQDMLRRRLCH